MSDYTKSAALLQILEEDFGANSSYVETMLDRYLDSPSLIDETWRTYFSDLLSSRAPNGVAPGATSNGNGIATNGSRTNGHATNGSHATPAAKSDSVAEVKASSEPKAPQTTVSGDYELATIAGAGKKIVENMEVSLTVPTATSIRYIPVKLLEENRRIINKFLEEQNEGKVSFTHLIAWAFVHALKQQPSLNDAFALKEGNPVRVKRPDVNVGIAIDLQKRDGSRSLMVPNIKRSNSLTFKQFAKAYDDTVKRARANKLEITDFADTTVSLTNPGTIGTVGSVPRLMSGQAIILATGAIEYPAEYQAMDPEVLTQLGVSKVIQLTSTYDHRIIQGAESGILLQYIHELLVGKHEFYDKIFLDLGIAYRPLHWSSDRNPGLFGMDQTRQQMEKQAGVLQLINAYRVRGHLIADIDPLHSIPVHWHPELEIESYGLSIWDLDREFMTDGLGGRQRMKLREIIDLLQSSYCSTFGVEFRHMQNREEKEWIRNRVEAKRTPIPAEVKKAILWKLISAEQFEQFVHKNFIGQKRFSVEGSETVIALLDQLIEGAVARGVNDIVLGMAHRGRLNVVANVLGHYCERIFTAFAGTVHPNFPADEGDVKYHQGAQGVRETQGKKVSLTLSPNPSHLEFVDAVVEGMVRAKQDAMPKSLEERWNEVLPVLMHGDAAFAGQGIVMETLNLETLKGYGVGGSIHIIVNNQIGFTTSPDASRSTIYSTDIAKMTGCPIFHINGDDPDTAYHILQIALDYRQQFHKDIVLDVVGFRRLGHNESDEPSYTQPLMYARVKAHKGVRSLYAQQLVREGVLTEEEANALIQERNNLYTDALNRAKEIVSKKSEAPKQLPPLIVDIDGSEIVETGTSMEVLQELTQVISVMPNDFHLNPKMVNQLARRQKMGEGSTGMDWAFGEAMAFGSLVKEGYSVRLSGQDSGRGTFSQRHAILYDIESGKPWIPLSQVKSETKPEATFYVYDSSLSEQGVLGYEYGYSVVAKRDLVLWEAQFGDFANGAQVIIDQFIASGEDKWQQTSRLVLLLPHGYEGQGPEHSSARLERFLQLCAENNMTVANATTPAQYFHLLRRQLKQDAARPLIVMTPKSLLRLPAATSDINELTHGGFQPVIDDTLPDKNAVTRLVFCSGKVYYDLLEKRTAANKQDVALLRLEQFYPFPERLVQEIAASYPNAKEIIWAQEEPKNMGGWTFVRPHFIKAIGSISQVEFVGRARSASPATGFYTVHNLEQDQIAREALRL